ncbi:MAG: hypothetical protein HQ574_00730 [Chloroflexi bacterium]|nr:hypothetical protein [Chloroflexota bacterium]
MEIKEIIERLGTLGLSLIEGFVEEHLGKRFVKELRRPTDKFVAVLKAIDYAEKMFIIQYDNPDLSKALFVDLKQDDRPALIKAVGDFFDRPSTSELLRTALIDILSGDLNLKEVSKKEIEHGIDVYLLILMEELLQQDQEFREKLIAIGTLRKNRGYYVTKSLQEVIDKPTPVIIFAKGDIADFTETEKEKFINKIANKLNIEPEEFDVLEVNPGSIRMLVEIPYLSMIELIDHAINKEKTLVDLGITSIQYKSKKIDIGNQTRQDKETKDPVVRAVDMILEQAVRDRASHIYIVPDQQSVQIAYLVEGKFIIALALPRGSHSQIIARIKEEGGLRLDEHGLKKQQYSKVIMGEEKTIWVESADTSWGEMLMIIIMDPNQVSQGILNFSKLVDRQDMLEKVTQILGFQSYPMEETVRRSINAFEHLPGIGRTTARKLTHYLMEPRNRGLAEELANAIYQLQKEAVKRDENIDPHEELLKALMRMSRKRTN